MASAKSVLERMIAAMNRGSDAAKRAVLKAKDIDIFAKPKPKKKKDAKKKRPLPLRKTVRVLKRARSQGKRSRRSRATSWLVRNGGLISNRGRFDLHPRVLNDTPCFAAITLVAPGERFNALAILDTPLLSRFDN